MDPWTVPPTERLRHQQQFQGLGPVDGFVTGEQTKGFLLQSQLPPPLLGQIWSLADVNCDGKMDINEFSVACKLITMKLRGFEIPPTLPPALKLTLAGTGTGTGTPIANTTPLMSPSRSGVILPPPIPRPVTSNSATALNLGMISPPSSGLSTPPLIMPSQQQPGMLICGLEGINSMAAIPPTSLPLGSQGFSSGGGIPPSAPVQDNLVRSMSITSQDSVHGFDMDRASASPLMEWAIPNPSRLKYTQLFNQNDRSKSGYLSGVQARNILIGTGLPQQVLASVWAMSDLDADGRLSSEEFILSMHLCDVARQYGRLPPKLPLDLIPPSFRAGSRKQSIKSIPGSMTVSGQNTGSNTPTLEPEPILSPGGTSFEDRRKQNYDKGQAELDRRRKVLEDMATREREERDRKEREEFEKREKQKLEIERRKQEELEQQAVMRREHEERRLEELRKSEEQKETARKEMERQRRAEMEDNKRQELLARRQKEQEEVLRLKGVNHGLGLELSQLADKVKELSGKITETRIGVSSVKSEIDGMRTKRDTFMNDTAMLKAQLKDQNNRMLHAAQEKVRIEKLSAESEVKQISLKQLREKLQNMKEELAKKQGDTNLAGHELDELKTTLSSLIDSCKVIYEDYKVKREDVIAVRKKHHAEFDYNAAWGSAKPASIHDQTLSPTGTVTYCALYDFQSRNPDELSFMTGAIIQRNNSVVPDPGWLSGWLDGKTGWFPESFVEVLPMDETAVSPETPVVSQPSVEIENYNGDGEYYIALYQYDSAEPGDLPFEPGDRVLVTESEGDWWTGCIGDRIGIFPANYVAKSGDIAASNGEPSVVSVEPPGVIHNSFTPTASEDTIIKDAVPSKTALEPFEEAEIKREMSEITMQSAPPKSPKTTTKTRKYEIATVLANYVSKGEGHLTLTRGQLITVRKKSPSGWWEGELQAKGKKREIGWFPGSYVKVLGPGGGSRQSSSRTTPIPFDEMPVPEETVPVYSDNKEQVIALYPYTAQNTDELTFIKDDVITIISKDEPDWWRGQLELSSGLFPVNYVQPLSQPLSQNNQFGNSGRNSRMNIPEDFEDEWEEEVEEEGYPKLDNPKNCHGQGYGYDAKVQHPITSYSSPPGIANTTTLNLSFGSEESKRQESIREMIQTEEAYMMDMNVVKECFHTPLYNSGLLTHDELTGIFVNWEDLIDCSNKLLKAFSVRNRTCENGVILMIGDILCQYMPAMITYIRFCSAQLRSASLIQQKTEKSQEFKDFCKKCQGNPKTQNLPLSSFLIKPMQRITRYPLLVKKILEHTPENHPDRQNLEDALGKAEELCAQVNEGVREKENSDRLEWMQTHINCEGLDERLIFNSLTNSLGPRKFLHHGILKKTKSGKELIGFLFNDFLLMAIPNRPLNQNMFSFDRNKNLKFKMYRKPMFLNEINCEDEGLPTESEFIIEVEKKTYQMYVSAPGISEKRLWMKSIREAKKKNHQVEQQYLQRQRSIRRRPVKGILRIRVIEGISLANRDPNGKSDPYCEVSLGSEIRKTNVIRGTLNPKWHDSMQFSVKDLHEDILCLTVYDKDYFSPDQFLGRTEIGISSIYEETRNQKTPWTKTFHLHEIETGNITIKFHLQIFERSK